MKSRYYGYGLAILLIGNLISPSYAMEPFRTPGAFVSSLAQKMLIFINDETISSADRQQRLENSVDADFDVQKITKFVLGRYWHKKNDIQQQKFTAAFRKYMVHIYSQRFIGYDVQTFKVTNQHPESNTIAIINTEIYSPSAGKLVAVAWRIQGRDTYKVLDLQVAGISVMQLKRSEFASYLMRNNGNLSGLTRHLQDIKGKP